MRIEQLYNIYLQWPSIQTDTRKLKKDDLFFALKGGNFNGNEFALKALENGAAYAIVDDTSITGNDKIIQVDNVLQTLQDLAKHHRSQFNIPFIAITGSNGKTTTKELVHAVLSSAFKTYTTEGNLNNHIGIPLTILKVKKDAEMAVIEMGANHQKEIESYCKYTLPSHGLITNCGKAHLEGFGGVEGVRKGKGELYDFLRANNGWAFVLNDYPYLLEMSSGIKNIYTYGSVNADLIGKLILSEPFLQFNFFRDNQSVPVSTKLVGDYNLPNALAAVAVGTFFKIDPQQIKTAIEKYTPSNSRSQLIEKGTNKIILDAYNANPSSMKAAIENFSKIHAENKILVLGGMAELGEESLQEHKAIIDLIQQFQWKEVILVGGDFLKINHPFMSFPNSIVAGEWFRKQQYQHSTLLVKGSRSIKMENILN